MKIELLDDEKKELIDLRRSSALTRALCRFERDDGSHIVVMRDEFVDSPLDEDRVFTLRVRNNRYFSGDTTEQLSPDEQTKLHEDGGVLFPLRCYIHSGVALSTRADVYPFNDVFDSAWCGMATATRDVITAYFGDSKPSREELEKVLQGELKRFVDYLSGNVYRFEVYDAEWKETDGGMSGFYGIDFKESGLFEAAELPDDADMMDAR